ncbi:hypothetical protein [Paraburkholderia saeva]|uniref:hypothetical protein n=1 Tax=Paraburkholderia saeva TaxID=2777537 RepID=UPI001D3CD1FB|nr:hypothetical protein [Paraburkholderia saeva]CAG4924671.1 hypothetical protein R52603_05289 [Paraburkholderia saeva]
MTARTTPIALRVHVESQIEKELARCERGMTPEQWCEHRDWVRDYVVTGAREWLRNKAREGQL